MPKLFQINVVSNMLSTGKICEDIAKIAQNHGWKTYIAYGRWARPGVNEARRIGSSFDMYEHYAEHRLSDKEGLASRRATRNLIKWMEEVKPDIIQLHNIHDHYLSYPILFNYLASIDTPVIWTQHDCWAFTGGCTYFDMFDCWKWKKGCDSCPEKRSFFCDRSKKQYEMKRNLLSKVKNITFVSVSNWLGSLIRQSFYSNRDVQTIHNGIDIALFKPLNKTSIYSRFCIIGVAAVWNKRKGLNDFIELRSMLPSNYEIVLVGLSQKQVDVLPEGIKGITRTSNIEKMVQMYSNADVFVNPTYSDNFPTTNLEALACGTPVITYKTGGSPEAVDAKTGIVIEKGDVVALASSIKKMKEHPLSSVDCRKRAEEFFDKDKCFQQYINIYEQILNRK